MLTLIPYKKRLQFKRQFRGTRAGYKNGGGGGACVGYAAIAEFTRRLCC
jgi:hypothetical protein